MEKQIKADKIVSDEEQIKTFRRVCLGLQKEAQAQWTRFPKIDYLPQVLKSTLEIIRKLI